MASPGSGSTIVNGERKSQLTIAFVRQAMVNIAGF